MKKLLIILLALLMISTASCDSETTEAEDMADALKISTWVLNKELEGTGYWAYDPSYPDWGYWVSEKSDRKFDNDEVFKFESLEPGNTRVMAPMGYKYYTNLNVHLDFDGIVEVETEIPDDERIRLAYNLEYPEEPWKSRMTQENGFRAIAPMTVNICPVGKFTLCTGIISRATLIDNEYGINIHAYRGDGTLVITAKLKLTVLNDEVYPYEENYGWMYAPNEVKSRFLSIELVSYEYSDIYKIGNENYSGDGVD